MNMYESPCSRRSRRILELQGFTVPLLVVVGGLAEWFEKAALCLARMLREALLTEITI